MSAMACPQCGGTTTVSHTNGTEIVIRVRTCQKCGHRFKTTETPPEKPHVTSYGHPLARQCK